MTETHEQRRTRILAADPETPAWMYDLALALGYEPESWDGMWMLPRCEPFKFIDKYVIITEMVAPFKKRVKLRPMPA